ncbi:hypothetical protein EGW08_018934 [Elysia chlorotica]|uniref:Laminin G domain-containing protein n=1 Tax=Elysia chlorotica TaxID=188477 RepID=A0A433SVJ1_ELYCH|nr:hypothetical protein EGW08_018934 [Elysia chlorotica]
MDVSFIGLLLTLVVELASANDNDPCFTFHGNGFLRFHLDKFDNSNSAHYSLKFRTQSAHGLLLYSEGVHGDDEALYIRNGMLVYHLFNSSPSGVEGSFGGRFLGEVAVNTDDMIEVHTYRSFSVTDEVQRTTREQTGLVYTVGGNTYSHIDYRPRSGISLNNDVYVGGYKESLSDTVGNFTGQISGIREEKNAALFRSFSLNAGGKVTSNCLTINPV